MSAISAIPFLGETILPSYHTGGGLRVMCNLILEGKG